MHHRAAMIVLTAVVLILSISSGVRGAGSAAADEAAIRRIIAAGTIRTTPDLVFWSGPYKRPTIGSQRSEFFDFEGGIANRVPGSQKGRVRPVRIVVSDSRDMAWVYSTSNQEFDTMTGKHHTFAAASIAIWEKQKGEWLVAASFGTSYE